MMRETPKSSASTASTKPNNVFYIWYNELCRRLNSNSAAIIRPSNPKCNTVLDFVADRLKFDDWSPLLNALRHDTSLHVINIRSRISNCQFLHEVDTEDKARRMKRKYGALWTDFILNSLVKALSFSMKKTQVLTCLELDGLPMFSHYLDALLKALMENKTLKIISLTNCSIQDDGCRSVCSCLQLLPNVEWLNLSRCDLSSVSGMYIAKLIKFQQLNRYTTSWHKSLRYSEPDSDKMCGIRRVTLNCNLKFGDVGLNYVLDELEDDLWIRALDVQKCGITEEISNKILDVLQDNRSLKIADFRQNEDLHPCTLERILDILREKEVYDDPDCEFHWCNSVRSLSTIASSRGISAFMDKSVVLPPRKPIKKSQISIDAARNVRNGFCGTSTAKDGCKKKLLEIKLMNTSYDVNSKPSEMSPKIMKKNGVEIRNGMKKTTNQKVNIQSQKNHTKITSTIFKTIERLQSSKGCKETPCNTPKNSPITKKEVMCKQTNGVRINGLINGFKKEEVPLSRSPSCLFEKMMSGKPEEEQFEDVESLVSSCKECDDICELDRSDLSDSQVSLFNFMQSLKGNQEELPTDPVKFESKYHYSRKKNGIK